MSVLQLKRADLLQQDIAPGRMPRAGLVSSIGAARARILAGATTATTDKVTTMMMLIVNMTGAESYNRPAETSVI